ncbi:MAG TPA: helix-turn-helix transcriptional regulator [Anaerovoracaceae bacterium]|nr:helix-turn-helix transcriptional regulator [Anaerovoracaceae bacterium]
MNRQENNQQEIIDQLKSALFAYRNFQFEEYVAQLEASRKSIEDAGDPPSLLGEWNILSAFQNGVDIANLLPVLRENVDMISGFSRVFDHGTPLLFDLFDPFGTFWLKPGEAEDTAETLREAEELWRRYTGGGQGITALYLARLKYYQGSLKEANALAMESYALAEAKGQTLTQLGASDVLGLLMRHGMGDGHEAIKFVRKVRSGQVTSDKNCIQAAQLILCGIYLALGVMTETPDFIRTGDFGIAASYENTGWYPLEDKVSPWLIPSAIMMRMQYLSYAGKFVEALNLADMAQHVYQIRIPLIDLYLDFWRCICYDTLGDNKRYRQRLVSLFDGCKQDGLWLIPAEDEVHKEDIILMAKQHDNDTAEKIRSIGQGLLDAMRPIRESYLNEKFLKGMTPREYDIAKLIYGGATNGDVAKELNISEFTVKNHLRHIYEKLEISGRRELANALEGAGEEIYAFWTNLGNKR